MGQSQISLPYRIISFEVFPKLVFPSNSKSWYLFYYSYFILS